MKTALLILAIWAAVGLTVAGLYAFFMTRYNTMRTASARQIERETAAIQRQVPDPHRAGCDVEAARNVHSLCKERARRDARHQARMEDLKGRPPVNPYPPNDPGYVHWAIELAEARTEIFHAKHHINQFNH